MLPELVSEEIKYIVTVLAKAGVRARDRMDESGRVVMNYPLGAVLPGYDIQVSSEGIPHVRVTKVQIRPPQWIRISEKDGSNPLVGIKEVTNPVERIGNLATEIAKLTEAVKDLAETIKRPSS